MHLKFRLNKLRLEYWIQNFLYHKTKNRIILYSSKESQNIVLNIKSSTAKYMAGLPSDCYWGKNVSRVK
jgi:hypothetical protein